MTIDIKKFQELKSRVEEATREKNKATGVLETLKEELQNEFGCKTIKEAKKLLKELQAKQRKAENQFNRELEDFEKEFGEDME